MAAYDLYGNPTGEDDLMSHEGLPPPDLPQPDEYGNATDASPLQQLLGGMPGGFNRTPDVSAPDFHNWVQASMDQAPQAAQAQRIQDYQNLIAPNYASEQAPAQRKITPLEYILGGLTEAAGLASHLRKGPHMQYRLLGRRGEKFMSGGRGAAPESAAPPVGSTLMNMLAAPRLEHQAEERRIAPINAARHAAMAKAVSDYAERQMLQRQPAPPPESPILTGYRAGKQLQDAGVPGFENWGVMWARHVANPTSETKQSLEEKVASLRAQGKNDEANALLQSLKDVAAARRAEKAGPKTPEDLKAEAMARRQGNLQADLAFGQDQGVLTPSVANVIKRARAPFDAQVKVLEGAIMRIQQSMIGDAAVDAPKMAQVHALSQQLDNARARAMKAEDDQRTRLRIPYGASIVPGVGSEYGSQYGGGMEQGAEQGAEGSGDEMGAAMPAGANLSDIALPDGSHSTEWTEEDWADLRQIDPSKYSEYVAAVAGSQE